MKVSELFDYTDVYRLLEDEGGGGDGGYTGVTDAGATTGSGAGDTTSDTGGPTIPPHDHGFYPMLFGYNGLLYKLAYAQMLANRRDFRIGQAIKKSKRKFKAPPALDNKYFRDGFKNPNKIPKFDY